MEQKREECVKLENQLKKVRTNDFWLKISLLLCFYFWLEVYEITYYRSMGMRWFGTRLVLDVDQNRWSQMILFLSLLIDVIDGQHQLFELSGEKIRTVQTETQTYTKGGFLTK